MWGEIRPTPRRWKALLAKTATPRLPKTYFLDFSLCVPTPHYYCLLQWKNLSGTVDPIVCSQTLNNDQFVMWCSRFPPEFNTASVAKCSIDPFTGRGGEGLGGLKLSPLFESVVSPSSPPPFPYPHSKLFRCQSMWLNANLSSNKSRLFNFFQNLAPQNIWVTV